MELFCQTFLMYQYVPLHTEQNQGSWKVNAQAWMSLLCHHKQHAQNTMLKHLTHSQLHAFTWTTLAKTSLVVIRGIRKNTRMSLPVSHCLDSFNLWSDHAYFNLYVSLSGGPWTVVTAIYFIQQSSHTSQYPLCTLLVENSMNAMQHLMY